MRLHSARAALHRTLLDIPWGLPDANGTTCAGFLPRAALDVTAAGMPRIERLMTDDASASMHSLRLVVSELGVTQVCIPPHCPWENGKGERSNRTLQAEWAYRQVATSNAVRTAAFARGWSTPRCSDATVRSAGFLPSAV